MNLGESIQCHPVCLLSAFKDIYSYCAGAFSMRERSLSLWFSAYKLENKMETLLPFGGRKKEEGSGLIRWPFLEDWGLRRIYRGGRTPASTVTRCFPR